MRRREPRSAARRHQGGWLLPCCCLACFILGLLTHELWHAAYRTSPACEAASGPRRRPPPPPTAATAPVPAALRGPGAGVAPEGCALVLLTHAPRSWSNLVMLLHNILANTPRHWPLQVVLGHTGQPLLSHMLAQPGIRRLLCPGESLFGESAQPV